MMFSYSKPRCSNYLDFHSYILQGNDFAILVQSLSKKNGSLMTLLVYLVTYKKNLRVCCRVHAAYQGTSIPQV